MIDDGIDLKIGRRLRRRRRDLGLTQGALGARVGLRHQQIQKYEQAVNRVSAAMIVKLAVALETPVGALLEGLIQQERA